MSNARANIQILLVWLSLVFRIPAEKAFWVGFLGSNYILTKCLEACFCLYNYNDMFLLIIINITLLFYFHSYSIYV